MIKNFFDFSQLTKIVNDENKKWKDLVETNANAVPMLKSYWSNLGQNFTTEQLLDSNFQDKWPWSAAYVSYIMTRINCGFPKNSSHRGYAKSALDNRNNKSPGFHLFSLSREKKPILCQVGDVLVKPRSGSYTNSHGDLVYKISSGVAFLAGGNLGQTNRINMQISLNADGSYPSNPSEYLVVLKKI